MSSLISDNLFLFLLIFGGALVSIRAHELYSTPSPRNDAQWLVNEMHLRQLTGRRQYASGLAFYLIPVLLIYLLLSVSPELLNLSMGIAGTSNSVGALTISGSEAQTFAPMLAATAVITLFSVKPFSIYEQAIRRLSHGVAGIPQHIQDIIRQVRQIDFRSTSAASPLPRIQLDHVKAIPGLDNDLAAIGKLNEWIFGTTGMLVWSDKAEQALQLSRQRILGEFDALKRKLALTHPSVKESNTIGQSLTDESLEEIVRQAREVRIQMTRLLAVLVANQDEPLPRYVVSQPLWDLVSRAQRKRASSRHMNILAASTMVGVVVSVMFGTLFNFSVTLAHELSINNVALSASDNSLFITGLSAYEFYWSSLIYAAKAAWWDVLGISLIFFTGCSAALVYRSARLNSAEWELWHAHNHPVFQYALIVAVACLSAGLLYELYLFVRLVVLPSLNVNNAGHFASMLRDFGSDYAEFGSLALLAAPSAVMVCRLSDNFGSSNNIRTLWRDPWVRTLAWSVGLVSMILYLFIRLWIGEIHELPAVLMSLIVPGATLFIMTVAYWHIGDKRPAASHQSSDENNGLIANQPTSGQRIKKSQNTEAGEPVT